MGASGSRQDRRDHLTVQGMVATFYEPKSWIKDEVRDKVEAHYQAAFHNFSNHLYGIVEIDGEETEEIYSYEAPGFYYIIIAVNDIPTARYKATRKGAIEMALQPKVKGGYGRILKFLSSVISLARGLVGF